MHALHLFPRHTNSIAKWIGIGGRVVANMDGVVERFTMANVHVTCDESLVRRHASGVRRHAPDVAVHSASLPENVGTAAASKHE